LASGYVHVIGLSRRACGCLNLSVSFYGNPKTLVFWWTKNAEVLSKSQHIHWHYYWYGNLPRGVHHYGFYSCHVGTKQDEVVRERKCPVLSFVHCRTMFS